MKIVVTGATGLIGKKICSKLIENDDEVIVFTRSIEKAKLSIPNAANYIRWDYKNESDTQWKKELNKVDAIIHLAGESVMSRRWNDAHKERVLNSRVLGTRSLVDAIDKGSTKIKKIISASAVGYYGNSETDVFTEKSEAGRDFLATVTKRWEHEVIAAEEKGVSEARIRIGIVLDRNEGALAKMLPPFKLFVGGPLGSGSQWFPWIHVDDVVGIFLHVLYNEKVNGPLNAVAPGIVNMKQFSAKLGNAMRRPSLFPVPEFILSVVLGEGAGVVTKGSNVRPEKTLTAGYKYRFENLDSALHSILK